MDSDVEIDIDDDSDEDDPPLKRLKRDCNLPEDYLYGVSILICDFYGVEYRYKLEENFPFKNHFNYFIIPKFIQKIKDHLVILFEENENINKKLINSIHLFNKMKKILFVEKDIKNSWENLSKLWGEFNKFLLSNNDKDFILYKRILQFKKCYEKNKFHLKRFYTTINHFILHSLFLLQIFKDISFNNLNEISNYSHINYYLSISEEERKILFQSPKKFKEIMEKNFYWRKKIPFHYLIFYWLKTDWKNSNFLLYSIWKDFSIRPIAFLGSKKEEFDQTLYNYFFLIGMKDGKGIEHELILQMSPGDADANTGIFGKLESKEGLWVTFQGAGNRFKDSKLIGDCGTYVKSFSLGNARFFPYKNVPTNPVPNSLFISDEDYFEKKSQLEKFAFTSAMISLLSPISSFPNNFPLLFRRSLMFSLLKIIQLKALKDDKSDWNVRLPDEILLMISEYLDTDFPMFTQTQIDHLNNLKRKEDFHRFHFEKNLYEKRNFNIFKKQKNKYSVDIKLWEKANKSDFQFEKEDYFCLPNDKSLIYDFS